MRFVDHGLVISVFINESTGDCTNEKYIGDILYVEDEGCHFFRPSESLSNDKKFLITSNQLLDLSKEMDCLDRNKI